MSYVYSPCEIAEHLVENPVGPTGMHQSTLSKANQYIAKHVQVQRVRVVELSGLINSEEPPGNRLGGSSSCGSLGVYLSSKVIDPISS